MTEAQKLPRFVEKLRSGQAATIVAYGDSIVEVGRTPETLSDLAHRQTGADSVVLGLAGDNPHNSTLQHQDETRAAIRSAAASAGVLHVDLRAAILTATSNGAFWEEFHHGPTDCHPNDTGHLVWAKAAAVALSA